MKIPSRIALIGRIERRGKVVREEGQKKKGERKRRNNSLSCTVLIRSSFKGLKLYASQATAS